MSLAFIYSNQWYLMHAVQSVCLILLSNGHHPFLSMFQWIENSLFPKNTEPVDKTWHLGMTSWQKSQFVSLHLLTIVPNLSSLFIHIIVSTQVSYSFSFCRNHTSLCIQQSDFFYFGEYCLCVHISHWMYYKSLFSLFDKFIKKICTWSL